MILPDIAKELTSIDGKSAGSELSGIKIAASLPTNFARRRSDENLPEEAFKWYLELRRYGSVPHSGFGMGTERVVAWMCGIEHIREAIPFPRTIKRVYP